MRIEDLIKIIEKRRTGGITDKSGLVGKDFIFVAVKGAKADGSRFINEAVKNGAKFVVCDSKTKTVNPKSISFVKVRDTRGALSELAVSFYKDPSRKIKVIGVTGTNGKTTITYLLEALLKEAKLPAGVIGTINYRFKNKIIPAKNTTPGPLELHSMLSGMFKDGARYVAMEVSSHALDQKRVSGINFHSAIFTNLTQDHLDYHKNFSNYFAAKSKLFKEIGLKSFVVINNDDKYSRRLKKITSARIITYGIDNPATVRASGIKSGALCTEFELSVCGENIKLKTNLIGRHNVYNVLAVAAWGIKEGISLKVIKSALEKFSQVPGRLERFVSKKGFCVFVDYAHTDDALKNVLSSLRQLAPGKLITLFGCGGDRDKLKRPKMGKIATELSDFAVITSDNPRMEKPESIIQDILNGVKKNNYCVITQRRKAIRKALALAKRGDIVLLAGKGHENYQVLNGRIMHFDDREEVRRCLRLLNY
jgi:UDP-N-acetylmuramoyl-L-alanyl-D-glutamate--2,6-diaminopimelate ligase